MATSAAAQVLTAAPHPDFHSSELFPVSAGYRAIMKAATSFATDGETRFTEDIAGKEAIEFKPYDPATSNPADPCLPQARSSPVKMEGSDGTTWYKVTR